MGERKASTTVYLTIEQRERLKAISKKTKVPVSEYIREGINLVIKKYEHVLPGQVKLFDEREK